MPKILAHQGISLAFPSQSNVIFIPKLKCFGYRCELKKWYDFGSKNAPPRIEKLLAMLDINVSGPPMDISQKEDYFTTIQITSTISHSQMQPLKMLHYCSAALGQICMSLFQLRVSSGTCEFLRKGAAQ
jgi:hypothetical protein